MKKIEWGKGDVKIVVSDKNFTEKDAEVLVDAAKGSASVPENAQERRFWGAPEISTEDRRVLNKIFELKQILEKISDPRKIKDLKERIKIEEDGLKESVEVLAKSGVERIEKINGADKSDVKEAQQTGQRLKTRVELAIEKADESVKSEKRLGVKESDKRTEIGPSDLGAAANKDKYRGNAIDKQITKMSKDLEEFKQSLKVIEKKGTPEQIKERKEKIMVLEAGIVEANFAKEVLKQKEEAKKIEIRAGTEKPTGQEEKSVTGEEKIKVPGTLKEEIKKVKESLTGAEKTAEIIDLEKRIKEARDSGDLVKARMLEEERLKYSQAIGEKGGKKEFSAEDKIEKRRESERIQEELDSARKEFANIDKSDPKYAEVEVKYKSQTGAMKDFMYRAKKEQLETKGARDEKTGEYKKLSPEEAQKELEKYSREIIVPHFAVVEAAKIQNLKIDQTFIEKAKDSRVTQFVFGAIDRYKKLSFGKKLLVSGGLIAAGIGAGAIGGAVGGAVAGAALLGKWTQRTLSAGGTAMATEAIIKKSQQNWMTKEGWGRNRQEFIGSEIDELRERVKKQEVKEMEMEEVGGMKKIEELLNKRKDLENKLEKRRIGIALAAGLVVGSGAASHVLGQLSRYSGLSDFISGKLTGVKDFFGWTQHIAPEKISKLGHIELKVGSRGPEGAIIDNFDKNPSLAKNFGWDGKADLHKWAGAKAHMLWNDEAHKALANPKTLIQLDNLGYDKNLDGYAQMMRRMGKGIVELDASSHRMDLVDTEYLENNIKQLEQYADPAGASGVHLDITFDKVLSGKGDEVLKNVLSHAKEKGLIVGEAGAENLQKIIDTPEAKFSGVISKLYESERKGLLKTTISKMGGLEKFINSPASTLFYQEGQEPNIFMEKLGAQLKSLTNDSYKLHDNVTSIKKVLESIDSRKIYGGTAEDLFKIGK